MSEPAYTGERLSYSMHLKNNKLFYLAFDQPDPVVVLTQKKKAKKIENSIVTRHMYSSSACLIAAKHHGDRDADGVHSE